MGILVLLDCDPGHDDALAIVLAAADPAIDLLGITTVAGGRGRSGSRRCGWPIRSWRRSG